MKVVLIELTDKSVYLARTGLETPADDSLTDKELVILDLHRQLEELKKVNNCKPHVSNRRELLIAFSTWHADKCYEEIATEEDVDEFLESN